MAVMNAFFMDYQSLRIFLFVRPLCSATLFGNGGNFALVVLERVEKLFRFRFCYLVRLAAFFVGGSGLCILGLFATGCLRIARLLRRIDRLRLLALA